MAADPSRVFSSGAQRPRTPVPLVGARFSSRSLIVAPVDISLSRATAAATDRPRFPSWKDPAAINVNTASRCFPSMASRTGHIAAVQRPTYTRELGWRCYPIHLHAIPRVIVR